MQYEVTPFIVKTSGAWGDEAINFPKKPSQLQMANTGNSQAGSNFIQRLFLEIMTGKVRSVLDTRDLTKDLNFL